MFSFLQPIWLYAIAGIVIPVTIHLWNTKEGKAFPVGSIALLEKSTKKYTRTVRISDWLLLLLRCLLIIFLAMLLAKPVKQKNFSLQKGWILLDLQNAKDIYDHFKPLIDSLLKEGYALHQFAKNFEPTNLKEALASKDSTDNEAGYWSLIKTLDNKLPTSFPVYVFTPDYLTRFKGARPQVNANIKWFTYSKDTAVKQIVKAWLTDDNHIRVMMVNSTSAGNIFSYEDLPAGQQSTGDYRINSHNGTFTVAFDNQTPVIVDTALTHICIYSDKNRQDASYIRASLEAIRAFTKRKIEISDVHTASSLPQKIDWLFWLSDNSLPRNITADNILKYEGDKEIKEHSLINPNTEAEPIEIYKRTVTDTSLNTGAAILWKDGFGNPLLTEEKSVTSMYHFYSRFNPQWNNLVWNNAFPSLLLQLIFKDDIENINKIYDDVRTIDVQQIQPAPAKTADKKTPAGFDDLSNISWVIIFLLFTAERMLSFKIKPSVA